MRLRRKIEVDATAAAAKTLAFAPLGLIATWSSYEHPVDEDVVQNSKAHALGVVISRVCALVEDDADAVDRGPDGNRFGEAL